MPCYFKLCLKLFHILDKPCKSSHWKQATVDSLCNTPLKAVASLWCVIENIYSASEERNVDMKNQEQWLVFLES